MTVGALLGGAVSLAVTLLLLLACSAAISAGILSEQLELHITIAACVVGGFSAGGDIMRFPRGWRQVRSFSCSCCVSA